MTHANPPDRTKLQCLGIRPSASTHGCSTPTACASSAERDRRDRDPRIAGDARVLAPAGPRPPRRSSSTTASASSAPATSATSTDDGYFFLVDRVKRMINASGFKVWPAEVETKLFSHPAVKEACVIAGIDSAEGREVRRWSCCVTALRRRRRHHRVVARAHGSLQGPTEIEFVECYRARRRESAMARVQEEEQAAARGFGALTEPSH